MPLVRVLCNNRNSFPSATKKFANFSDSDFLFFGLNRAIFFSYHYNNLNTKNDKINTRKKFQVPRFRELKTIK